jgi:hypothetical protein
VQRSGIGGGSGVPFDSVAFPLAEDRGVGKGSSPGNTLGFAPLCPQPVTDAYGAEVLLALAS